jgi:hypothetical protein
MTSDNANSEDTGRQNAKKSTGPRDTRRTRFNGVKHGLTSMMLTDLDDRRKLGRLRAKLKQELQPQGTLESFLVDRIAVSLVRCERATGLESQRIQAHLHPPKYGRSFLERRFAELTGDSVCPVLDPGLPAPLTDDTVRNLHEIYGRYEVSIENRLFRYIAELERLQTVRNKPLSGTDSAT